MVNYLPVRYPIKSAHKQLILKTVQQGIRVIESSNYDDKETKRRATLMLTAYKEIESMLAPANVTLEILTPYRRSTDE